MPSYICEIWLIASQQHQGNGTTEKKGSPTVLWLFDFVKKRKNQTAVTAGKSKWDNNTVLTERNYRVARREGDRFSKVTFDIYTNSQR